MSQFIGDAVREKLAKAKVPSFPHEDSLSHRIPCEPELFMGLDESEIMSIGIKLDDLESEIKAASALIRSLIDALYWAVEHDVPEEHAEEMQELCWKLDLHSRFESLNDYWSALRKQKPGAVLNVGTQQEVAA
jgi:hypothetical protein